MAGETQRPYPIHESAAEELGPEAVELERQWLEEQRTAMTDLGDPTIGQPLFPDAPTDPQVRPRTTNQ